MNRLSFSTKVMTGLLGTIALVGVSVTESSASQPSTPAESSRPAAKALPALLGTEQSGAAAVQAASLSTRYCFPRFSGLARLYVYIPVSPGQAVAVSATEHDEATDTEFIGAATISVHNVTVTSGLVNTVVNAAWGSPIRVCLHYLA